ncbi:AIPR family protein [Maritalea mobilis]|uniref:AIPR family protein n=1 Tax=Maritalea mobilis TaxID=483324 RepID=UPI001C96E18B|nr:AIPR family protein [Maritalea mobilis]MBY6201765.1 AIPR family protein [Maritalea mobilis]
MSFEDALSSRQGLVESVSYEGAYIAQAIALFIEEPDVLALASEGFTDGSNDKKIDFIYHDVEGRRLIFAQGYYSKSKKDSAPANKASDLNTAAAWIVSGNLDQVPENIRNTISGFRQSLADGEIEQIDLIYVHNLPESVNVALELQTVEAHLRQALANENITVRSHELGKPKLDHLFAAQDSHIEVKDDIDFPFEVGIEESGSNWQAGVATITGEWIKSLYEKYGDKLYSANYRGFLGADGRRRVNSGIKDTIERSPTDFWAFNNGITILTLSLSEKKSGKRKLSGISIINGAQTSGTIGSVALAGSEVSDVKVLGRVIQSSDQDTIDKIVRFNNTQNQITTWDRFANDADQNRISSEFAQIGFSYNRKRGFNQQGEQIGIEQVLQPLLGFHGRPRDAVRGKAQLFLQKNLYNNAFENKKARHILLVYTLARAIDAKRLALKKKSNSGELLDIENRQLELLRNLNFKPFLLAVIANSLEVIVGTKLDTTTVAFDQKTARDSSIAELVARWVPVVESILPLLIGLPGIADFYTNLRSQDDYLSHIKGQMDGMLLATGQQERLKDFASLISPS